MLKKSLLAMSVVFVGLAATAKPVATGSITFDYIIDDKIGVTHWAPTHHKILIGDDSPLTIDQHKDLITKSLVDHAKAETLFDAGQLFKRIGSGIKSGAKKAADTTVSIVKSDEFKKATKAMAASAAMTVAAIAALRASDLDNGL